MDIKVALLKEHLTQYVRLGGGYSFPLAGAIYWGVLAVLGEYLPLKTWLRLPSSAAD
jgi:hypothetical protein